MQRVARYIYSMSKSDFPSGPLHPMAFASSLDLLVATMFSLLPRVMPFAS